MQFDRFFVYKPAAIFGEQTARPMMGRLASVFKPLTYLSNSVGINITTLALAMVINTVKPATDDKPQSVVLENADMIKLTGLKL